MLKSDLHCHVKGDPIDNIPYTPEQLIDKASAHGYSILAITCHDKVIFNDHLKNYAASRNILLIPGAEKTLQGKHVLLYNITQQELENITTFDGLRNLKCKKNDLLVIAPHPYYPGFSLQKLFEENHDLFDGIEYSHFYFYFINFFNKQAERAAKKYNQPLIGNSDCHIFTQFGTTYSLIDTKQTNADVVAAIRSGKVTCVSKSLSPLRFAIITLWIMKALTFFTIKKIFKP